MQKNLCTNIILKDIIESFLKRHPLPAYYSGEESCPLMQFISKYKDEFLSDFDKSIVNNTLKSASKIVYDDLTKIRNDVEKTFDYIIIILEKSENSFCGEAESIINNIFNNFENDFCVTDIDNYRQLPQKRFRIRSNINRDNISSIDLFHVPYSNRNLLSNERFSVSGQPCLYLSTSLNIAWRECGMPSSFYYAEYEVEGGALDENMKFLSFIKPLEIIRDFISSPDFFNKKENIEFIYKYLRTFPIIFACSIVSLKKDYPFKPEYVFPQLVMQWIHRNIHKIKGIMYFSCVYDDDDLSQTVGYNIAMPATNFNSEGYSETLLSLFKIKEPVYECLTLNENVKLKFKNTFNQIRLFEYDCSEMIECHLEMQRLMLYIYTFIEDPEKIPPKVFLTYSTLLFKEITGFRNKYNCSTIIENCKKSTRYVNNNNLEQFEKIFLDFLDVLNQMYLYKLKYEHHIPGLVDNNLNYCG